MFNDPQIANIEMKDGLITVSQKDLNLSFNYSSIQYLYINNEMDETAREMTVSLKKLKRTEPGLADLLYMNFTVNGVSLSFIVNRGQGEPIALYVENEFRRLMLNAEVVPGSLADILKEEFENDDPDEVVYPIYFHGCHGLNADSAEL